MKKIVCIGDSLTYGYGVKKSERWSSILENEIYSEVLNKGICGDTSTGVLSRIYRDVILNKASEAIIMIGTNDFIWGVAQEQVRANIATVLFHMLNYNINSIIAIPTPVYSSLAEKKWKSVANYGGNSINDNLKKLGVWIKEFSKDYTIRNIDFNSMFYKENEEVNPIYYIDGLHLNSIGHKKIAKELVKIL
ncbi:esterase [Clostridium pasteurianum DSM 525 = ATCC 6013]|uniref:Esterase n=1 Tax=Clostridium pasteurianum DSM 525 = ATCC 6013 TaxID=1262449 RepID=A0A0H3J3J6_CLOPA|nr:GDSL-type esterase/lipase family protein [Clostridium pasteurianum]AJA48039.1 esterase [Clostridium pasteurianum DSM 525 = ATCC 6013]AJA52027.1 esterase [Clostridium pasteurianum DSM 525 = ATCC 6013]AOZ77331.1 arylesterase [Clostridium pasteurianum DSM 525 = ATCC 6013]AOZ81128.1 arylesterase [Clostridium pasteurianum]ELP59941.1 arylesterase [Clostridium pasteurianum DSM 525 = ATCC 6013]